MSQSDKRKMDLDASCETTSASFVADPNAFDAANEVGDVDRALVKMAEIVELLHVAKGASQQTINGLISRAVRLYDDLAPADGAEAMLAQQMIGTHAAATECLKRAARPDASLDQRDMALKHAEKLMALYVKQLAALDKHRGKGQQKVTVEHVHVEAGGQAIVGNVAAGASAARADAKGTAAAPERISQAADMPFDARSQERATRRRRGS